MTDSYTIPEGHFSTTKFISVNYSRFGGWGSVEYYKARKILAELGCVKVGESYWQSPPRCNPS